MVSSLATRVGRLLEATGGDGGECPRCGWAVGDDFGPDDTYELVWVDPDGTEDREKFCEACGRQLVYVLTWGRLGMTSILEKRVAALEASCGRDGGCERCRNVLTVIRSTATGALYSASWNGQNLSDEELGERRTEFQCPKCGRDLRGEQETVINIGWPQVNQYPQM